MSIAFNDIPDDASMGFPDKETMIRAAKVLQQANIPFHFRWLSEKVSFPVCETDEIVFEFNDAQEPKVGNPEKGSGV